MLSRLVYLSCLSFSTCLAQSQPMPSSSGNFALRPSQQPGPLIGFGENILERNEVQLFLFGDFYLGNDKHFADLMPGILYGITNDLSLFFNVPVAASYKDREHHSYGFEDLFLQLEYAVYTRFTDCFSDQVTIVLNAACPTGSAHKRPPTGFGSMSYFAGATYNRTWSDWFCFAASGAQFALTNHTYQIGNQYLYQCGLGRNITNARQWIFAWMAELDGTFACRNRIGGNTDPNSGGNFIYLTPSLWASSDDWIVQFGWGFAIQQHLFGHQAKDRYLGAFNIGKTY